MAITSYVDSEERDVFLSMYGEDWQENRRFAPVLSRIAHMAKIDRVNIPKPRIVFQWLLDPDAVDYSADEIEEKYGGRLSIGQWYTVFLFLIRSKIETDIPLSSGRNNLPDNINLEHLDLSAFGTQKTKNWELVADEAVVEQLTSRQQEFLDLCQRQASMEAGRHMEENRDYIIIGNLKDLRGVARRELGMTNRTFLRYVREFREKGILWVQGDSQNRMPSRDVGLWIRTNK